MLIVGIENPQGETHYIAAAFPSACGKTNLAMLIPPEGYREDGWKVWTVGDDICWMRPGADGRLYAINPEAGFFGVAPGTSAEDQSQCAGDARPAMRSSPMSRVTADNQPWWEGLAERRAGQGLAGPRLTIRPTARPRIPTRASPCQRGSARAITDKAEDPQGVPLSRDRVRRPPRVAGAAGVRSARLDARRAGRRRDGARKPPPPRPARSAWCVATRWR